MKIERSLRCLLDFNIGCLICGNCTGFKKGRILDFLQWLKLTQHLASIKDICWMGNKATQLYMLFFFFYNMKINVIFSKKATLPHLIPATSYINCSHASRASTRGSEPRNKKLLSRYFAIDVRVS